MNLNELDMEMLERYIDHDLSDDEKSSLEQRIATEPNLHQELNRLQFTRDAIQNFGLRKKVESIHDEMMREMKDASGKTIQINITRRISWYRIAASILLLAGLFGLYKYLTPSPDKLFKDIDTPFTIGVTRGSNDTEALVQSYRQKDYSTVLQIFSTILKPQARDIFFAAQSHYANKNFNQAITLFKQVIELQKQHHQLDVIEDAEYFIAMSYIQLNQLGQARPFLEKIHTDPNHRYHDKVSSLTLLRLKLAH